MERSVSHGDGPFSGWLADWLIDDPVAILTEQYDRGLYSTVQLNMSPHSTTYWNTEHFGVACCYITEAYESAMSYRQTDGGQTDA